MDTTTTIKRPEGVKVIYRRMKFEFEKSGFQRYWLDNHAFKSLFWSQLSAAFAPGEAFFIDSARALKSQTKDPALREEIAEFCKQEGHHTAQHLKFDRMNQEMGVDVEACRRRYKWILDRARANMTPMEMLAATAALEHFTSGFAHQLFNNKHLFEGADPKVFALWAWHAAEEAEHRATCFDLYKQLGGSYGERTTILVGAWFFILAAAVINTADMLRRDKKLFSRETLEGVWYLFGYKGLISSMVPSFLSYFKPNFHPWQGEDGHEISQWSAENSKYIESTPAALTDVSRTEPSDGAPAPGLARC